MLEINGQGPEQWPPPGLKFNPGPYAISVSAAVVPAVARLLDANHKKPWGVITLEVASFAERFHDAYAGPWGRLGARAAQGREIWVNSCASCHAGPGGIFGGGKSGQAFPTLAALAAGQRPFLPPPTCGIPKPSWPCRQDGAPSPLYRSPARRAARLHHRRVAVTPGKKKGRGPRPRPSVPPGPARIRSDSGT